MLAADVLEISLTTRFLAPISLALIIAGTALNLAALRPTEAAERPNVLIIAIDDLNDWLGCYGGHPQAITPHIDQLAGQGIRFTNAHCAAPVCKASRSAIFSGRLPDESGIYGNKSADVRKVYGDGELIPAHFARSGYETLGTGKLLHGKSPNLFDQDYFTEQRWSPFSQEQATYTQAELASKGSANPRHEVIDGPGGRDWVLPFNGLPSERNPDKAVGESFDWGPVEVADSEMGDGRITDWAIDRLGEARPKPFFFWVLATTDPISRCSHPSRISISTHRWTR